MADEADEMPDVIVMADEPDPAEAALGEWLVQPWQWREILRFVRGCNRR
jgi:hypothetical protein